MKYFIALALTASNLLLSDEKVFQEGDTFEARKFEAITLYFYRADATRLDTARDFAFSLNDFMTWQSLERASRAGSCSLRGPSQRRQAHMSTCKRES